MKKGKYLVTGCAGFIGSNLVKKIYKDFDLILVDDFSEGIASNLPKIFCTTDRASLPIKVIFSKQILTASNIKN